MVVRACVVEDDVAASTEAPTLMNLPILAMASKGPRSRMCHICGRQYVISSFEFHVKQCKKLFLQQQEKLPEGERRALPPRDAPRPLRPA